jgi:hypothetical protein
MALQLPRSVFRMSVALALLIVVASAGGLLIDDLYRDNLWASSQFRGSDLVRLVVAVPLLIGSILLSRRGSLRATLIWLGLLWTALYDYAFYLFGAAFNRFFLIYVALLVLAIFALLFALARLDVDAISRRVRMSRFFKWISGYMLVWAGLLGGLWIVQSLGFVFTGQVPQPVIDSGHPTGIVYALDLTLLMPAVVLGAIWLWRQQPWGYIIAVIVNVKAVVYTLALLGMGVFAERVGVVGATDLMPLWAAFSVASLIATIVLLANLRPTEHARDSQPQSRGGRPVAASS